MRSASIIFCFSMFLLSGCSNADSSSDKNSIDSSILLKTNPENTGMIPADTTANIQSVPNVPNVQNVQNGIQTLPASATAPVVTTGATTATQTAAGMNPAHGQPGHRCEIAVGAPLNSAPAKPATTTSTPVSNQPVVTSTTPVATPAATPIVTAPGMNPPHGQPGHKCEIAVGAPLNSAPAKTIVPKSETIIKSADGVPAGIELPAKKPTNDSFRK